MRRWRWAGSEAMNHCAIARANEHNPTWSQDFRAQCLLRQTARKHAERIAQLSNLNQRRSALADLDVDMREAVQAALHERWVARA